MLSNEAVFNNCVVDNIESARYGERNIDWESIRRCVFAVNANAELRTTSNLQHESGSSSSSSSEEEADDTKSESRSLALVRSSIMSESGQLYDSDMSDTSSFQTPGRQSELREQRTASSSAGAERLQGGNSYGFSPRRLQTPRRQSEFQEQFTASSSAEDGRLQGGNSNGYYPGQERQAEERISNVGRAMSRDDDRYRGDAIMPARPLSGDKQPVSVVYLGINTQQPPGPVNQRNIEQPVPLAMRLPPQVMSSPPSTSYALQPRQTVGAALFAEESSMATRVSVPSNMFLESLDQSIQQLYCYDRNLQCR
jgi:hypothetical protein